MMKTRNHKNMFDILNEQNSLKPYLIQEIALFLDSMKMSMRGRKRQIDWERFFTCLFFIADNGMKMSYIKEYFGMSRST